MPRLALTGGAYEARSVIASAQRCLNLFAEPMPQAQGEPSQFAYYPTPGLRLLGALPKGPVRGIKQVTTGGIYAVGGDTVYLVNSDWSSTALGTITPMRPYPVSMQDNGNTLVIVDGTTSGWTVDLASNAFAAISDTAFYGADRVDYLDTYFILNKPGTPQFYISGSLATTWDALDFANKESFSDLLVTIAVAKREIWLLGQRTTEVWYNQGLSSTADFTFAQIQGTFVDQGCCAKYSVATYDDAVYWLAANRAGQGIVLTGAGYQTKRISTFAIENELTTYPRIDDAIGFTYLLAGHIFYVLTFPAADRTWVYDIATQQWHEWLWIDDNGEEHRHRANCAYAINGTVVMGDHESGNLYAVENTALTDNGQPIKRQRSYPHVVNELKRVYYRQFIADIESGNPLGAATSVTTITKVVTWLPEIAQLVGASNNSTTTSVVIDWQRGYAYFTDNNVYQKYAVDLATQSAPIASATADGQNAWYLAMDPLSGELLTQRGTTNGEPVLKLDPTTFAVLGTFGTATSLPSYPTSVWVGQFVVCVVCNGVSYGFLKESTFSGHVAAFRVDTMQQAGFYQNIVTGSIDSRGAMCAGKSGAAAASVFLSWDSATSPAPSIPLYVVNVTAGAELYNPASWPTTNSHITWTTVGTIAGSAVDPAWTNVAINSLGYDLADGNVLMWVYTNDSVAHRYYLIKVNATTAVVLWTLPVSATTNMTLERSRINGSLWVFDGSSSQRIDTLAGQVVQQIFQGTTNNLPGYPMTDSEQSLALYFGNYTSGANTPIAVTGTSPFTNGWGLMGGQTEVSTTTTSAVTGSQIFLSWSDDRAHTFGSPVGQPIGATGAYLTNVQWQRLGLGRDRCFKLEWSVPVATALLGAYIELDSSAKS